MLRGSPSGTRLARAQALTTYFLFLELRHKVEIHRMAGRVVECPIDEMNRPRGSKDAALRIPPTEPEIKTVHRLGRRVGDLPQVRPHRRNYTASKLMSQVGLRVSEACKLDLADIKWDLGSFGKLHVRHGKGARGSGPRERMVPLINGADRTLGGSSRTSGASSTTTTPAPGPRCSPPSARTPTALRAASATTPCATVWPPQRRPICPAGPTRSRRTSCGTSALYLGGLDLLGIREVLGHSWIATMMRYIHVQQTRVEDAWVAGQQRAAKRPEGLMG
ncbi:site-specific integrase [Streptomyces sp. NPDC051636]|uniref:site-specific integrase n=1 Tax=Streptomyces sp. NPDC051636 TaxID=3365663 RepID=UPI0037889A56